MLYFVWAAIIIFSWWYSILCSSANWWCWWTLPALPRSKFWHTVPLSKNHKKLKRTELQEKMQSMTHFQKLTKLSLQMAMLPSVISSSILAHASHTTSEMMTTLKPNLLLRTKAWAPWRKYGITPILVSLIQSNSYEPSTVGMQELVTPTSPT